MAGPSENNPKNSVTLDLSTSPDASIESLLGQIYVLFKEKNSESDPGNKEPEPQISVSRSQGENGRRSQPCEKCSSLKESYRKYRLLTQKKIDSLEKQLREAKQRLSQTESKSTQDVVVLAEDSLLFDSPVAARPRSERPANDSRDTSSHSMRESTVQSGKKRIHGDDQDKESLIGDLRNVSGELRADGGGLVGLSTPGRAEEIPETQIDSTPSKKVGWIESSSMKARMNPRIKDEFPVKEEEISIGIQVRAEKRLKPNDECIECQRFFKNLDASHMNFIKKCSKHRSRAVEAVVPTSMWRTAIEETQDLMKANDTLPCDLNVERFVSRLKKKLHHSSR